LTGQEFLWGYFLQRRNALVVLQNSAPAISFWENSALSAMISGYEKELGRLEPAVIEAKYSRQFSFSRKTPEK